MVALARLRSVRQRKALTQQELADKAGVNRVTIARLEGGVDEPRPATLRKLAAALGVEPVTLMGRSAETRASEQPSRRAGASSGTVQEPKSGHSTILFAGRLECAEDERVRQVLTEIPGLAALIGEAADQLMRFFPDARLKLKAMTDPDETEPGDELILGILTMIKHDEALAALGRFDSDWWIPNIGRTQGRLNIDLAYE
jgi:transcriptional regulator with XRE-family HTH domain